MSSSILEGSTASSYWYPTPLMRAPSSATSKALSDTGVCCSGIPPPPHSVLGVLVCVVWGDPPTAPSGGDSCHQFTEGLLTSGLCYCSHDLEEGEGSGEDGFECLLVWIQSTFTVMQTHVVHH